MTIKKSFAGKLTYRAELSDAEVALLLKLCLFHSSSPSGMTISKDELYWLCRMSTDFKIALTPDA